MTDFMLGCNYWASHAAVFMWRDWRPDVVEEDFKALAGRGVNTLRVFPLWCDFQPITLLYGGGGREVEYSFGEAPLPDDEAGRAGIDMGMIRKFEVFADLAERYNLKLIVSLITGWMSGRQFVPQALWGCNLLTDPKAMKWEIKFIDFFVRHFRNKKSIAAWDFGNECNTLAPLESSDQAWLWSRSIASAIREADSSRPVLSGMHGLSIDGIWRISDQSETTDMLTTHPYPIFTPHCNNDPLNTMRPIFHAAAESLYYSGIGGKPCMVEEAGTITGSIAGDKRSAEYLRASLFTALAHNLEGYLWWCAFDQAHIPNAPYDWNIAERELGLMTPAYEPKPYFLEMEAFSRLSDALPCKRLPMRIKDGVCIVGNGTDAWGIAYNTFALASRAGLELDFQSCDGPIKDASLYMLPSVAGYEFIKLRRYHELMKKVYNGATLYMSLDCPYIGEYLNYFGIEIKNRYRRDEQLSVHFNIDGGFSLLLGRKDFLDFDAVDCEVLAEDEKGNPAYMRHNYGKGLIYLLNFPLETSLINSCNPFSETNGAGMHRVYMPFSRTGNHAVFSADPNVVTTEHPLNENERICISVNCMPGKVENAVSVQGDWTISKMYRGDPYVLLPNNAAVYLIVRR